MLLLSACNPSFVLSVTPPTGPENPSEGLAFKITAVEDLRQFEVAPKRPDIPSLADDDIHNAASTSHAIGRLRDGFGRGRGNDILPAKVTVADLVEQAVASGIRRAGYRLLTPGAPDYDHAVEIRIQIKQFWDWIAMGFSQVTVHQKSEIVLSGSLPGLRDGIDVESELQESGFIITISDRRTLIQKGLDDLAAKVAATLSARLAAASQN
jgi:hypothetical protein